MRDAFAGFCDALFNPELRDSTTERLRREGILSPGQPPPESRDERVEAILRTSRSCLIDLIYRFQFISDDRDYQNISAYVNNAPLLNQFVHEFIQNAEDAGARRCRFVFEDDRVLVVNDGVSFTHQNLHAICSFRESDKASHHRGLQIGKFGVGFKSVFRIARSPLVVTWDESMGEPLAFRFFVPGEFDREYHSRLEGETPFRFSPRLPERERDGFPSRIGYLFPVPVPLADDLRATWELHRSGAVRGSMFFLPLRPDLTSEQRTRIFETVEPESFFFLKMASLEMLDLRDGRRRFQVWTKQSQPLGEAGDLELLEIDEREDEASPRPIGKAIRLFVGPIAVPRGELGMSDSLIREALPEEVAVRIVAELDADDLIDPGHHGARRKGRLFNGLPVPGVATGLNFHVDAPFNLSADRTNILDDGFNEWLLGRVAEAACRFLAEVRREEPFRNQVFRLVPADLTYGRSKGGGELAQRFAKVHDRLRDEARHLGVLPALDCGEPLRPGEALALRGADAGKDAVARAIQALIGGEPLGLFARTRTKIQAETLRLVLIPEDSYEESLARVLGQVESFSPRWMRAALEDPGWRARIAGRNPRWYAWLFRYIARGSVTDSLEDFLDVAWVPGLSPEDDSIPPRDAAILEGASAAVLGLIRDGLRVAGGARAPEDWRFAHPDFVREYIAAKAAVDNLRHGARRLDRLFARRLVTWGEVVDRLVGSLEASSADQATGPRGETPREVWDLIDLLEQKGVLTAESAGRIVRSTGVAVASGGPANTTAIRTTIDLLLRPAGELRPVPGQIEERLPRLGEGYLQRHIGIIARLTPEFPSPALIKTVLERIEAPSQDTVAWVAKLAGLWQRTRNPAEIRGALGPLRIAGKHSGEFRPLASYCRGGFGSKGNNLAKSLTHLFGPKVPDWDLYAAFVGEAGVKLLRTLVDEKPFLPAADDLRLALGRLATCEDDEKRIALATDLAEFLGQVWDHYAPAGRRDEMTELRRLLQETSWLPATAAQGRHARPDQVVLLEHPATLVLLGDAAPVPLLPESGEESGRWLRALRELGTKVGLAFRDANGLGRDVGRALAATLRRRLVDCDVLGRLDLIGRLLRWDWFAREAGGLKEMIDLSGISTRYSPGSADVWLVCETAGQRQKLEAEFPRGVVAVHDGTAHVRRALIWASGGMEAPKESPLADPDFAMRFVRALAGDAHRPLEAPACDQVVRAYRTLARGRVGPPWFDPEERVILTEAATLESAMTPIYAGDDREVRSLLAMHKPGRCLVAMVHELGGPELPVILDGLRLASPDYRRREVWVRNRIVPHGNGQVLKDWPSDRTHIVEAIRKLIPDAPADLDPDQLCFKLVDAIERHVESPILGMEYHVEAARLHLDATPPVLYLTSAGRVAVESELLRLVDRKKYEERELFLQSLRRDWAKAQVRVEDLAGDQKNCLLYNYRIASYDPAFRKSDQELDRQHKSVEERWANFLADPGRIAQVIRKHTTDLGYGKETIARELIQNIDDAYHGSPPPGGEGPWVEFRDQDGALIVSHAGRRFSGDDLERICGLGGSGKSEQVQIGRFGLGFKSVLGVTAEPIVISHPYSFAIRHVVVPEWLEPEGDRCRRWHDWQRDHGLTRFVLPPAAGQRDVEELIERLVKQEDLAPRVLLFLRNLEKITVSMAGVERRTITRSDRPAPDGMFPGFERPAVFDDVAIRIRRLEVHEAGRIPSVEDFVVIEGRARIPVPDVSGMQVKALHCGIALPWNPDEQRFGPPLGADSRLYLFLPTKTRTGLPFVVHGEFLTNLGRTDIDGENPANVALARALAALVRSTLESAFARWHGDRDGSRAVTRMAPWPGEVTQEAAWLRPIRGVFAEMIKSDEPVVLTVEGVLARPSECVLGRRLAHAARESLLAVDPSCPVNALVDPEIEMEVGRAAVGAIQTLTGRELVELLFPNGLKRNKVVLRVRALLQVLYAEQSDDLTQWTERSFALNRLSSLPCMPDDRGGVSCPVHLENPDRAGGNTDRRADLDEVAGADAGFRRWIIENLRWASPPPQPPPPPPPPGDPDEVLISPEDRKRIWAHNLRRIADWWWGLAPERRRNIAACYSLTGPSLWPILGLGDCAAAERAPRLRGALREDGPGHERVWFRVLCLANVAQSGRRHEEGVEFLRMFDVEFGGFERLWCDLDDGGPGDAIGGLIRRAVHTYINDRSKAEQASFWRRIYDFVKIRTLLRERQFLAGFWDTADEQPEFLARYLARGHAPGLRFEHRGLGESLSSQAFFLCRECHRLGIIHGDRARENCYAPNRHLIRFIARACGPEVGEWPDFKIYEALSHELHREVFKHTGSRDFGDHFDLPLFHLALQDEPSRVVPGLLMRDDIEGIRRFLRTSG